MFKSVVFFASFLAVTSFAATPESTTQYSSALPEEKSGFSLIPVLGISSFDIKGPRMDKSFQVYESSGGLVVGAIAEQKMGTIHLGGGLVYQQTGTEADYYYISEPSTTYHTEYTLNYIAVPVYVKYYLFENLSKLYVRGGAQVGYLTRANSDMKISGPSENYDVKDLNVTASFSRWDFILQPALGLEVSTGDSTSFVVDVSFNYGLSNIFKEGEKARNQGINLLGGFAINL